MDLIFEGGQSGENDFAGRYVSLAWLCFGAGPAGGRRACRWAPGRAGYGAEGSIRWTHRERQEGASNGLDQ
jgi:hypothetical protein